MGSHHQKTHFYLKVSFLTVSHNRNGIGVFYTRPYFYANRFMEDLLTECEILWNLAGHHK